MTSYLVDTNVLAAIGPRARRGPQDEAVAAWLGSFQGELYLSVITAIEIEEGIAKAVRRGATRKAADLREWWGQISHYYGARILLIDVDLAKPIGELLDRAAGLGLSPGFEDISIAATAIRHGHIVLTRNVRHFAPLGVQCVDPFDHLPQ